MDFVYSAWWCICFVVFACLMQVVSWYLLVCVLGYLFIGFSLQLRCCFVFYWAVRLCFRVCWMVVWISALGRRLVVFTLLIVLIYLNSLNLIKLVVDFWVVLLLCLCGQWLSRLLFGLLCWLLHCFDRLVCVV